MPALSSSVDFAKYLQSRVSAVTDSTGAFVKFDCPWCNDHRQRGWFHIVTFTIGCFNSGCFFEERRQQTIEWARQMERFPTVGKTWAYLLESYPVTGIRKLPKPKIQTDEWCRLPPMSTDWEAILARPFRAFIRRQWGLNPKTPEKILPETVWGLGWCREGEYAGRVIIPITMGGQVVAFQARTIVGQEPKYLTSPWGPIEDPRAMCGRPAASILFNLDDVQPGDVVVLVEGPGDVMAWKLNRQNEWVAVGLLGVTLTPEKLALLKAKKPGLVIVALDNEPAAQRRALKYLDVLQAWGFNAARGAWVGAKDAGAGARLEIKGLSLRTRMEASLG